MDIEVNYAHFSLNISWWCSCLPLLLSPIALSKAEEINGEDLLVGDEILAVGEFAMTSICLDESMSTDQVGDRVESKARRDNKSSSSSFTAHDLKRCLDYISWILLRILFGFLKLHLGLRYLNRRYLPVWEAVSSKQRVACGIKSRNIINDSYNSSRVRLLPLDVTLGGRVAEAVFMVMCLIICLSLIENFSFLSIKVV